MVIKEQDWLEKKTHLAAKWAVNAVFSLLNKVVVISRDANMLFTLVF